MAKNLPLSLQKAKLVIVATISIVMLLSASSMAYAQAPTWQTAMAATGNFSSVQAVAADASGNVYLAGNFSGTVNFGSTALTEAGAGDLFVAKWNSISNSFVWAQRAGGSGFDHAQAIAVNGANVYVAGEIVSASANFGGATVAVSSSGNSEAFVAKLTDAGNSASFTWVQQTVSTKSAAAYGLAVNGTSVYVTGSFGIGTANFGAAKLTNSNTTSTFDIFVAKLTDYGANSSFIWASRAGGAATDYGFAVAVNGSAIYITGEFASPTADFGSVTLTNANTDASNDVFVTKLIDRGTSSSFVWAQQAGGTGNDGAFGLAVNGANIYLAGTFSSPTLNFGSTNLLNAGLSDVFVAKLIDTGSTSSFGWAQRAGGSGYDSSTSAAVSGTNVYVAGSFSSPTATFGAVTLTNTGTNTGDVFVTKLTDTGISGNFVWTQQAGGTGNDAANAIAVQGTAVYVGSVVAPPANFGNQVITNASITTRVGVVASLMDNQALATTSPAQVAGLELYPNPANAEATILLPFVPGATQATFILTDALGKTVLNNTVALPATGLHYLLNLVTLTPGLYALQVQAGATLTTRHLAIK